MNRLKIKITVVSNVCSSSMLRVSSSAFCSMSLLFDYMCMCLPFISWSIAGVPSSQALPGFLITAPPSVCVPDVIGALACGFETQTKKCRVPVRVPHAPIWEEGSCTYCAEQVTVQGGGGTGGADLACCPILLVNRCDAKRPVRWSCANRPSPSCSGQRRATCRCRLHQP